MSLLVKLIPRSWARKLLGAALAAAIGAASTWTLSQEGRVIDLGNGIAITVSKEQVTSGTNIIAIVGAKVSKWLAENPNAMPLALPPK